MGVESVIVSDNETPEEDIVEIKEPENPIKSIDEIPEVLEEEEVKQPVIYLENTINGKKRNVVLLGETHIATREEERAAGRILSYFKYISCEGVDTDTFIEGKFFFWIMDHIIGPIMSLLVYRGKRSSGNKSFLDTAQDYRGSKSKKVFMLEEGWRPNIRIRIFSVVFPIWILYSMLTVTATSVGVARDYGGEGFVIYMVELAVFLVLLEKLPLINKILRYIVSFVIDYVFDLGPSRNRNMMKNLITELNNDGAIGEIIVVSGSGHTRSLAKLLKNKYGFVQTGSYEPPGIYDS